VTSFNIIYWKSTLGLTELPLGVDHQRKRSRTFLLGHTETLKVEIVNGRHLVVEKRTILEYDETINKSRNEYRLSKYALWLATFHDL
jgi:hypothetical protein